MEYGTRDRRRQGGVPSEPITPLGVTRNIPFKQPHHAFIILNLASCQIEKYTKTIHSTLVVRPTTGSARVAWVGPETQNMLLSSHQVRDGSLQVREYTFRCMQLHASFNKTAFRQVHAIV